MIFTVYFNQQRMVEWGLNANQAALVSLLNQVHTWAELSMIDGKPYFWVSRQRVTEELPGFFAKADTVYRAFRALVEKGLIEYVKHGDRDMILLTPKIKLWNIQPTEAESEKNPTLGNKSETRKNLRESSEINPNLLGNKSDITDNQRLNNHRSDLPPSGVSAHAREDAPNDESSPPCPAEKPKKRSKADLFCDDLVKRGVEARVARAWWPHRDNKLMTDLAWERHCREAAEAGLTPNAAARYAAGNEWRGFHADGYFRKEKKNFGGCNGTYQQQNRKLNPVEQFYEAEREWAAGGGAVRTTPVGYDGWQDGQFREV